MNFLANPILDFSLYKNIDTVIVPKFIEFKNFLSHIDAADLTFLNAGEIQKYIYTKYPLSNTRR